MHAQQAQKVQRSFRCACCLQAQRLAAYRPPGHHLDGALRPKIQLPLETALRMRRGLRKQINRRVLQGRLTGCVGRCCPVQAGSHLLLVYSSGLEGGRVDWERLLPSRVSAARSPLIRASAASLQCCHSPYARLHSHPKRPSPAKARAARPRGTAAGNSVPFPDKAAGMARRGPSQSNAYELPQRRAWHFPDQVP